MDVCRHFASGNVAINHFRRRRLAVWRLLPLRLAASVAFSFNCGCYLARASSSTAAADFLSFLLLLLLLLFFLNFKPTSSCQPGGIESANNFAPMKKKIIIKKSPHPLAERRAVPETHSPVRPWKIGRSTVHYFLKKKEQADGRKRGRNPAKVPGSGDLVDVGSVGTTTTTTTTTATTTTATTTTATTATTTTRRRVATGAGRRFSHNGRSTAASVAFLWNAIHQKISKTKKRIR